MIELGYGTPIEEVQVGELLVRVKRDDLANGGDPLAPSLGKLRGLLAAIRAAGGATTIGAVDRRPTSRNTWATAYLCKQLGLRCHAFFSEVGPHQRRTIDLGARYTVLPGLELEALYAAASAAFYALYPSEGFLPIDDCQATALVEDARAEVHRSDRSKLKTDAIIIPTGSGGLALGVMRGLADLDLRPHVILHIGGSRRSEDYIQGVVDGAGLRKEFPGVTVTKASGTACVEPPFPCNPTYERPAWDWMVAMKLSGTMLFWNAGG